MAAEEYIRIKPNPLTNLTITSGNNTLVVSNMSTYYRLGLYYNETYPIVISADGYNSVTISDWTDWSNHTVSEEGDRLLTLKPSHLYAWTDSSVTGTHLYAWTNTQYNATIYTNTLYPVTSGPFYNSEGIDITISLVNGDCGINSISSSSITWGVGGKGWMIPTTTTEVPRGEYIYDRDSSKDIVGNPTTVYTDSTTLTTGMTVYDNTGTDTGYVVTNINNNEFDITNSSTLTLTVDISSDHSIVNTATNFVIEVVETGEILYTASSLSIPNTITVNFSPENTIKISNLIVGNVIMSGTGCWYMTVENCSETHDSISSTGTSYSGYYNNVVLSNFTDNPNVVLGFGYGKA